MRLTHLIPEVKTPATQVTVTVIGPRDGHVTQWEPNDSLLWKFGWNRSERDAFYVLGL